MTCDVPVPRPIIMGDLRYNTRDYVVVEITTDEGLSGFGWGMARYAPVAEIIERNLKPLLIGEDPLLNEHLWDRLYYLNLLIAQRGIYMRALSVVDIALWDLKGKAAGLPVWKLLGGHRRPLGVPADPRRRPRRHAARGRHELRRVHRSVEDLRSRRRARRTRESARVSGDPRAPRGGTSDRRACGDDRPAAGHRSDASPHGEHARDPRWDGRRTRPSRSRL